MAGYGLGGLLDKEEWEQVQAHAAAAKAKHDAGFNGLNTQSGLAGQFANQGEQGFGQLGQEAAGTRGYLNELLHGQHSLAQEQLRQGLQQNVAAQQSMAAGAAPQNQAMAALAAAQNASRLGAGMSGQAATAGIQERNAAAQTLGQLQNQARGQDLMAALQSRQNAISGYGNLNNNQTAYDVAKMQQPSGLDRLMGVVSGAAGAVNLLRQPKQPQ